MFFQRQDKAVDNILQMAVLYGGCLDLTYKMKNILAAWQENGFLFDAFLTGYLGSAGVVDVVKTCFSDFSNESAEIIIDPAFGDNGRLYPAYDGEYVTAMADLIKSADIILPNLTDACFLAGIERSEERRVGKECRL